MKYHLASILICMLLSAMVMGQEGTYYYGPNGRPVDQLEDAISSKQVIRKSERKYIIKTHQVQQDKWTQVLKEKVKIQGDNSQLILYRAERFFPKKFYREMEKTGPGEYSFSESDIGGGLIRNGTSARYLPLHLEGTVTEYHTNREVKSVSLFRDNQLITNQNWLRDGSPYIDSIFYSVDQEPEYEMGDEFFKSYLISKLSESDIDLSQIEDQVVLGWVVMDTGEIDGAITLRGKSRDLNSFLLKTITELPGLWQPALLNGLPVRYFMSIPLNFMQRDANFQELDLSTGRLHYSKY